MFTEIEEEDDEMGEEGVYDEEVNAVEEGAIMQEEEEGAEEGAIMPGEVANGAEEGAIMAEDAYMLSDEDNMPGKLVGRSINSCDQSSINNCILMMHADPNTYFNTYSVPGNFISCDQPTTAASSNCCNLHAGMIEYVGDSSSEDEEE